MTPPLFPSRERGWTSRNKTAQMNWRVVEALKRAGMCEYEAQAYFTLLVTGPAKASELTYASLVPQSKLYLTASSLEEKGLVKKSEKTPKTFRAMRFSNYANRLIQQKRGEIEELEKYSRILDCLGTYVEREKPKLARHIRMFEPRHRRR